MLLAVQELKKAVNKIAGVTSCSVSLLTNSMSVDGTASSEAIISAVRAAGYDASEKGSDTKGSVQSGEDTLEDHETPKLKRRLIASF